MGTFLNTLCTANTPSECEFVYDGAKIAHDAEFECHICNRDGVQQANSIGGVIEPDDFVAPPPTTC